MSRAKANPSGNPRGAVDVAQAPVVHDGRAPRVPSSLGSTGKEVWREVWKAGQGAYHPQTDRYVIERYCALHDRRTELLDAIDADGLMTIGSTGQPVPHPLPRYVESTEKERCALSSPRWGSTWRRAFDSVSPRLPLSKRRSPTSWEMTTKTTTDRG
ncbi:phage terminase small subunit P27 family [Lentzea flaviverrucosa]|uniref:Phage terminase, small subunit, putative, P27 family n=1 Tax=Lentzea flaviverrucosa TaxID=200379 RepID=A0A1H9XYH4_9PSEU|nr:phage terminase small subunit P27 family [Lentzea flaviverrucosa]RDI16391.1 P27 family predicted phage terminase small subunit [Lentzea flaviverrucosa]SES51202.1 phage terminase, small subunit, putative, P27 family [Lentzea flaviverrucosa]